MKATLTFHHKDLRIWKWKNGLGDDCLSFEDTNGNEIKILSVDKPLFRKQINQPFLKSLSKAGQNAITS